MPQPFPALLSLILAAGLPAVGQAQQSTTDLTDPEVAHVAVTSNTIDVEAEQVVR